MVEAVTPGPLGLFGWYEKVTRFLAAGSMLAVVGIMVVQVIARYVFNSSLIWAEELCRYILVWQTFLFVGYAYYRGELVVLDLFSSRVSPAVYLTIRLVTAVPVCLFLVLIIYHGIGYASRFSMQMIPAIDFIWMSLTGEPAGVPIFWVYVAVPVGCTILLAHYVVRLAFDAHAVATGKPIAPLSSDEQVMPS